MKSIRLILSIWIALFGLAISPPGNSQSQITVPSSGTIATEAWAQDYVFDMMEKYVKSDCDLRITNIIQTGTSVEFGLATSLQGINNYTVKIEKGEKKWFWYSVPYTAGQTLKIQNVPPLDSLRVTIRPTLHPTCYVSTGLNTGTNPDPVDPNPGAQPCVSTPTIGIITSINSQGLNAAISGSATNLNWSIYQTVGSNLRTGNVTLSSGNAGITWSNSLSAGTYTLKVEGVNCIGTNTKTFIVPESSTQPCTAGPTLTAIYDITANGVTAQFHGNNVTLVNYTLYNAGGVSIRTGQISPGSPYLGISFSTPITAGTYVLRLDGANCTGFSTMPFTYTAPVIPGDPDPEPVEPGDIVAKYIGKGMDEHMDLRVVGTGTSKVLTDFATMTPPSGYEFWYFINDRIIKQSTRLVNYPWQSNAPVGIFKGMIKIGASSLAYWGSESWQDPNLGWGFSYNSSMAFASMLFEPANTGYDITRKVVHWMDHMPDAPVVNDGDVWIAPVGPIDTPQLLAAKGITHFPSGELQRFPISLQNSYKEAGKTYAEVPKTMAQLNLNEYGNDDWVGPPGGSGQYPDIWNNRIFHAPPGATQPMTNEQATAAGNNFSTNDAVIVFENSEQYYAIGAQWPFWRYYYNALTSRLEAKFPGKWRLAHNYFTGLSGNFTHNTDKRSLYGEYPFVLGTMSRSQAKLFLGVPLSEYPSSEVLPGGVLEKVNSVCFGVYLGAPDTNIDMMYRYIHQSALTHKANKYFLTFIQAFYEWRPNNISEMTFPDGKIYQYIKLGHNPATTINLAFMSRVFGDGFIPWSSASKTGTNFRWDREFWNTNILWIPNGSNTPQSNDTFPYWGRPENFPGGGFEEFIAIGMHKYFDTFAKTTGGSKYFLKFRVDGGAWVDPATKTDYSDLVDALYDKRPIVYAEVKDGKMAVMYLNPYEDDGNNHTLEFQNPTTSATYTMQVASTVVQEKLINL